MIDTHCHLTYQGLHERVDAVVAAAYAAGVDRMITVGTTPEDTERAVALAQQYDGVFATLGLHPHYAMEVSDRAGLISAFRRLVADCSIVALGEMGLDRHYDDPPLSEQQRALEWQLELAADYPDLPIIIHNREATEQTLEVLGRSGLRPERFVFHCFTGSNGELDAVLDFGAMVSFTGVVTFSGARELAEATARVPLDRIMVETDAPYLTPEPYRKVRPNEPQYVREVARTMATARGMDEAAFIEAVDANAIRFFGLPGGTQA